MKFRNGEIIITNLLSVLGKKIVAFTRCNKCYGRGYKNMLTDKNFHMEQMILKLAKHQKRVSENLEIGPYFQCKQCETLAYNQRDKLELELHQEKYGKSTES